MIRSVLAIVIALVACACSKPAAPEATPEAVAAKYFTALGTGDCAGITATSGGDIAKDIATSGCAASLNEAKEHKLIFVATENLRVDGRDPNARLLDVKLQSDGKEKRVISRLERIGDAWKVVTL
ncbi:MAG: hypothetical protein ABI461_02785 [Polyangiaceae bacterium]